MARNPPKPSDVVTLADLAPRHRVVGGAQRHVFGADPSGLGARNTKKPVKDLPPKSATVKGGGRNLNESMTLVRAAKPAKKDLPAAKNVKGGRKAVR